MPQKRIEYFRLLLEHLAWIEHQFLSGIRDSRKAGSLWGMMRGVERVRKSKHQSWLAKGLGLGLLYWGSKGVQQEILLYIFDFLSCTHTYNPTLNLYVHVCSFISLNWVDTEINCTWRLSVSCLCDHHGKRLPRDGFTLYNVLSGMRWSEMLIYGAFWEGLVRLYFFCWHFLLYLFSFRIAVICMVI